MTDESRRPKNLDVALTRLIEECAEIQHVVCKIKRFGVFAQKPGDDKCNIERLALEVSDLYDALEDVFKYLDADALKLYNDTE